MKAFETKKGGALPAPDTIQAAYLNTAGTAETFDVPDGASYVVFSSTADFYAEYIEEGEDTDIVTLGDMSANTDWTEGVGWSITGGKGVCDGSQVADTDLSRTADVIVEGQAYRTTYTVSSYSAGNVVVVVGGTEGTDRSANGTHTETVIAGANDDVALRGDLDFAGNVDDLSIAPIAILPTADNITAAGNELNPDKRYIANTKQISLVAPANGTIVTMAFYKEF